MKSDAHLSKPELDLIQVSLREFLERLVDERGGRFELALTALQKLVEERDRLYISKFDASQRAVDAALTAQKEATATNFLASEKAIVKAEAAQADYNVRSNEFRGQLDDQAKTLMPRIETMGLFRAMEDKIQSLVIGFESKLGDHITNSESKSIDNIKNGEARLDAFKAYYEKGHDEMIKQVTAIRAVQNEALGRLAQTGEDRNQRNWNIGTVVAVLAALGALVVAAFKR